MTKIPDRFSHLDQDGRVQMVDIGDKPETRRTATAAGCIRMQPETLAMIQSGEHKKGDIFAVARIAGIQAAKRCAELIPLCHFLNLTLVDVRLTPAADGAALNIEASCSLSGKTGAEMEVLTAVSVAALTVYDMCKAVDKGMVIENIRLLEKEGGRSGHWKYTE